MHCLLGAVALGQLLSVPLGSTGRGNVGVVDEMGKLIFKGAIQKKFQKQKSKTNQHENIWRLIKKVVAG